VTVLDEQPPANVTTASFDPCNPTCIPQIYTPNPNCSPWSRAAQTDPMRTGDPCLPDTPPERCPPTQQCSPDTDADPRKSASFHDPGVPAERFGGAGFLWLDLTRDCSLKCDHCYNASGPSGDKKLLKVLTEASPSAALMQPEDWFRVLHQGVQAGVTMIQLIGGEPTMYHGFTEVLTYALKLELKVEVFSNLVHVRDIWWPLFQNPAVSLATSYYSDDPAEHDEITGRDSHRKTRANISRAIQLGVSLRVGIVHVNPTQRVREARRDLEALGVKPHLIGYDRVRAFGRGRGEHASCDVNELCGRCGDGRAAIGPDGTVTPCIMSSWLGAGNVKTTPLAGILAGKEMAAARVLIPARSASGCDPDPDGCRPDAYPCQPQNGG